MVSPVGHLDLQAAAAELHVHYQTAYRWVRSGRLKAKLVGGRYVVVPEDLAALDQARHTPKNAAAPSASRIDRSADRVHDALVSGDEVAVGRIVRRLIGEGSSIIDVVQDVFVPSLHRIGQSWHDGELTVSVEHRASAIAERILGELAPNPRGRRRGTAIVVAVSGDRHSLPTTMAAIALRDDNWHVQHLGADLPADEIIQFCAEHDATVAVLTVTTPDATESANVTATRLRSAGTPTIVGGPGRTLDDLIQQARLTVSPNARSPRSRGTNIRTQ